MQQRVSQMAKDMRTAVSIVGEKAAADITATAAEEAQRQKAEEPVEEPHN